MTEAEYNALVSQINTLKAETENGSITPNRLGSLLNSILSGLWGSLPDLTPYAKVVALTNLRDGIFVELAKYYTKTEIDSRNYLRQSELTNYATISLVNQLISSAVADLASREDIPSVAGLASQQWVNGLITTLQTSVNGKAAKTELRNYAKLTDVPSLEGYAKVSDLPSLEGYARKTDIPSMEGLATISSVDGISKRVNAMESSIVNLGIKPVSGDANVLNLTGRYFLSSGTNIPSVPFYIEVMAADTNFIVQRGTSNDGTTYQRVFNGSVWSEWS